MDGTDGECLSTTENLERGTRRNHQLVVGQSAHELWMDAVARVNETGLFPPVQLPSSGFV